MKRILPALFAALLLFSCTNNGEKLSKDFMEVYYKDGVTKEEAQKALDYFLIAWKENNGETPGKSIQLTRKADTVHFNMVSKMEVMDKMPEDIFYTMGNELSENLFAGSPVNITLTDKYFKPVRSYTFKKMDATLNYGEKVTDGNIEVYAKDGFSLEQATTIAGFLSKEIAPANTISFQVGKNDEGYYVISMASDEEKAAALDDSEFNTMAAQISANTLDDAPLIFQLTDPTFKPFKTFTYKITQ
jgi:hypothetical protein